MRFNVPLRAPPRPPLISQIKEKHFPTRSVAMIKNQFNNKRALPRRDQGGARERGEHSGHNRHNSTQLKLHKSKTFNEHRQRRLRESQTLPKRLPCSNK